MRGTRPRVIITDKLGSYAAAKKDVLPSVEHRRHKRLNNRAENAHQPTRQRERGYPLGGYRWRTPTGRRPEKISVFSCCLLAYHTFLVALL